MTAEPIPLVLGGNTFGWTSDEAESFAILDAFVELGGTMIDTADVYSVWAEGHVGGESEVVIGRWLASRSNTCAVVATKVSRHPQFQGLARSTVFAAADASLARLGVDRLGIYYAHYDDDSVPIEVTVEAFRDLQQVGKVDRIGLSNYSGARVAEWIAVADANGWDRPAFLQPHYNLVHRGEYERELAPIAQQFGLQVVPYFALASGFLSGKYRTRADIAASPRGRYTAAYFSPQGLAVVDEVARIAREHGAEMTTVALAWLLSRPNILAPIASARVIEQLPPLADAGGLALSADDLVALDDVSSQVA